MKSLLKNILVALLLAPLSAARADEPAKLPPVPSQPIAKKKELLFADDFKGNGRDKRWHPVVDTFTFENGALAGKSGWFEDIKVWNAEPAE